MTSPLKNDTHELLQFLTPQERAEIEALSTPPSDAAPCVAINRPGQDPVKVLEEARQEYIKQHGYAPPGTLTVNFVKPSDANLNMQPTQA